MKQLVYALMSVMFFSACGNNDSEDDGTPPVVVDPDPDPINVTETAITVYSGYELIWNDEFNTASLDLNKWSYETGTGVNGDFGTGQLDRATGRLENVSMVPGTGADKSLAITTRREFYVDRSYTSGRINTQGKFQCGPGTRIEARIWARDVNYKGQGFAFWMMPAEKPDSEASIMWPQGGEVDIMEYVGSIPSANLGTVHYAWFWENNQFQDWNHGHKGAYYSFADEQVPAVNPQYGGWPVAADDPAYGRAAYHLYRIDWYEDRLEFSVDNQVYHINYFNDGGMFDTAADGEDDDEMVTIDGKKVFKSEYSNHLAEWQSFSHEFYLILSAGVGGNDNMTYGGAIVPEAVFPCTTLVDYVRVYNRL